MDNRMIFLLCNLALAFYNVGTIWAHEMDIFRAWTLLDADTFQKVQGRHWRKLPYWVFTPVGLSLMGSIALIWYHPNASPGWAIWGNLVLLLVSHVLTVVFWGPLQAKLSKDPLGSTSPFLYKILRTHWIRTALINGHALTLFIWAIKIVH